MFEEFRFSLQRMSAITLSFSLWVSRNQATGSQRSRQLPAQPRTRAPCPQGGPCSNFKEQFNGMVYPEATQGLGVGLGHPKLGFSVRN